MFRRIALAVALLCAPIASPSVAGSARYSNSDGSTSDGVHVNEIGDGTTPIGNVIANGAAADGAAPAGNPVLVACEYVAAPGSLADGRQGYVHCGLKHAMTVTLCARDSTPANASCPDIFAPQDGWGNIGGGIKTMSVTGLYDPVGNVENRARGDNNGMVVQSGMSATFWNYASGTAGIFSNTTTAVTMKTAAGAGVRNYVKTCQIATTAFGAAVPIAIRDGAGGTVLWAAKVPTGGWLSPVQVAFDPPLKGTANTLVEVVTTTANTSGTADVNCQGFTGS